MLFDVRQTTFYAYGEAVPSSRHLIRMVPLSRRGQTVLSAHLSISPPPHEYREGRDFFGNQETRIAIETPHDILSVTLTARIDRVSEQDAPWIAALTLPWEDIAVSSLQDEELGLDGPAHYLFPSRMVRLHPAITAYAAQSFSPGRPILEAALALTNQIKNDFVYDSTATHVDTDIGEAFTNRRGVCQDFSHIMIAGLRGLGVPARYISGWLRTEPPPGQKRLEGADATHAWVEVWCGPAGWIGLDPTNGIRAGQDHLILAEGRDYADIAPLDGIIWSSASHSLSVSVDVVPVEGA